MDKASVDRLVGAVLYEGYLLYPYRQALKNAKRWTFGAIYPAESQAARSGAERSVTRARVLLAGDSSATIEGEMRFLHPIERTRLDSAASTETVPAGIWHETEERRVEIPLRSIEELSHASFRRTFSFAERSWREADVAGAFPGDVVRRQRAVRGAIELTAAQVGGAVYLLVVSIFNETSCGREDIDSGECSAMLQAFASAHLILSVRNGQFVSRIDPPPAYRDLCPVDAADGLWPVLIGAAGERDTMLCSPIILYDYPEIAPESPGDFFDATEIDEMLMLRVLTLSDEEKLQVAALDARGRALLRRAEGLDERLAAQLHGTTRSLHAIKEQINER